MASFTCSPLLKPWNRIYNTGNPTASFSDNINTRKTKASAESGSFILKSATGNSLRRYVRFLIAAPTEKRRRRSDPRGNATGADPAVSASCFILGTSPPPVRRRPYCDNIYFSFFFFKKNISLSFSHKIKGKEGEKGAETWSFIAWSRT